MDAGVHAVHWGAGAGVSGEVKVHKRTWNPSRRVKAGGARIIKQFFTLKVFKIIEKFGF